jgi:hypothetical protein
MVTCDSKKLLRILGLTLSLCMTQCGVRRDPIPQHTQEGPHAADEAAQEKNK